MTAIVTVVALVVGQLAFAPAASAAVGDACSGGSLQVMAHEDDDLLFTSPDMLTDITNKKCVRTLYLTAGDAGYEDDYWAEREKGIEAAYAYMAGVSNAWSTKTLSLAGKSVRLRTLNAAPNVSVVFMRLPDGGVLGGGTARRSYQSIKRLLDGTISTVSAVDGSASYTASTLRNAVLDAMRSNGSTTVRTHDYVSGYGEDGDHYDHHSAGFVARDASGSYSTGHLLRSYMGYDTSNEAANVTGTNLTRKRTAFLTHYGAYDDEVNAAEYESRGWISRQYIVASSGATVAANAGPDQAVAAGSLVTLDGTGTSGSGTVTYAWAQTAGTTVSLSSSTSAKPTFTPTAAGTYTFRLTAKSGSSTSTATVNVTVTSADYTNLARQSGVTATASSQESTQPASAVRDGSYLGWPDDSTKEWATVGGKAASWVKLTWPTSIRADKVVLYDRPNANDQVLGGTLTFSDGSTVSVGNLANSGATTISFPARATTSIQFTVTSVSSATENIGLAEFEVYGGTNQAPVANAGAAQNVAAGTLVTLDGSASSDPDAGTTLTYAWAKTSGPAATLSSATAAKPTFTPTTAGSYVFELTVSDGALTSKASVTITVTAPVNRAPVANAGTAQSVTTGTLVTLDGSGSSDPDGNTLTYAWAKTSGPAATLSSATAAKPTFTPSTAGSYVFELTVSDGTLTSKASVTITVTQANRAPVANAGSAQTVNTGTLVTLDGSASSDPDAGTTLTYAWAKTSGPAVTLSNATVAKPTFTATTAGTYVFELTVSDGTLTNKASVTITVNQPNRAPVANAGVDQSVAVNTLVRLDGSGSSDPDGNTLTYAWAKTSGPAATLSSTSAAKPTFTPTTAGTYIFELTVSDGTLTNKASVTIVVGSTNQPPVANAGSNRTVNVGTLVTLDGSASSDPDAGTTLTYAWAKTSGPAATLSSATAAKPTFTPSTAGSYVFELTVSDGALTNKASVTITVNQPNRAPTANAGGAQTAVVNTLVTLDGSGSSDPDGNTLTYAWAKTSGPAATLSSTSAAKPTFTPTTAGSYVFELTVSDGTLTSKASVTITVTNPANRAPVANAGAAQSVTTGTLVTLDGSGSSDPDGNTLTYAWAKTSGPAATLSSATAAKPTFTPSTAGSYVFELTVSDGTLTSKASVTITVTQANRAPVANAGSAQNVNVGTLVALDGSASSDPDGNPLTYAWAKTSGPAATLSNASVAKPTFTATTAGTYVFELTVSDGTLTNKASVTIIAASTTNLARIAGVTVTQSSYDHGQEGTKAVDGVVAGWPEAEANEWSSMGEKRNAWLQLAWASPVTLDKIVLYDRPNTYDRITGGKLTFSDGSSVTVPALDNAGGPVTLTFAAKTVTSVRLTVTSVSSSTQNIGLAEIEAWGTSSVAVVNRAPVANAGNAQAVVVGSVVTLDGSKSSDPDPGTSLTYAWRQTGGPAATLSSASVAKPVFTAAAAGAYTFELTVSDGALTSKASVTITATTRQPVNVARLSGVTVTQSSYDYGQQGSKAVDGVVAGWPLAETNEWSSLQGKAGSWLQLTWSTPTAVDRIVLYDRPNTYDQILGGTLSFSDGSSVTVPALDNAGGPVTLTFPAKTVTSVRLTVNSVSSSTENIGLAEIEVWEAV